MRAIFDLDSPIMQFLARVADLMILNVVFLVTCIPVFTIGAAWTALSYVTLKMAAKEEGYVFKGYLKAFKNNFKKGTLLWLLWLVIFAIIACDFFIIHNVLVTSLSFMNIPIVALTILAFSVLIYVFPLNARFENTVFGTMKNACLFAIGYFPRTLAMVLLIGSVVFVTNYNATAIQNGILFWILIGFALMGFITAKIMEPILENHM